MVKKTLILTFGLIFCFSLVTAASGDELEVDSQIWTWTTTSVISDTSDWSSQWADIKADLQGNLHVVWNDADAPFPTVTQDVVYQRWDVNTGSWGEIELISPLENSSSITPRLDIDSDGNVHVVWSESFTFFKDQFDRDTCYSIRNASTGAWTGVRMVSGESTDTSSPPVIDVNDNGIVGIAWADPTDYDGAGSDYDIFMKYYNVTANRWSSLEVVSESAYKSTSPDIAVNPDGDIQIVWMEEDVGTSSDIAYRYFDSESQSWSAQIDLTTEVTASEAEFPSIITESQYTHVVWNDGYDDLLNSGADRDLYYKRLDKSLGTWTDLALLTPECSGHSDDPQLALDAFGNLYVVWDDSTNIAGTTGSDVDILLKSWNKSTDSWNPINVVSTESGRNSDQAKVCVDLFNFVHVVWTDLSDFGGADLDEDIFYKKFAGLPYPPVLSSISPNPDTDGTVKLQWSSSFGGHEYSIYRDSEEISSVSGITPLHTTVETSYTDEINTSGLYYYVITANNPVGESALSNVESVTINLPTTSEPTGVSFTIVFMSLVGIAAVVETKRKHH
ncbi:MAG: hypothetical protein ACFFE8_16050 [Candidatus Heimdallarchaeota archaeon]